MVLPPHHEGMSNVLLEAASSGRALITSDIPGCREAVCDGRTGSSARPATPRRFIMPCGFAELPPHPGGRRWAGPVGYIWEACFDRADVVRRVLAAMQEEGL